MSDKKEHTPKRLPPVRLPFEKRKTDFGAWSYKHRVGIFVTLIAYLLFGIIFISAQIRLSGDSQLTNLMIELPKEEKQELTPEQQKMLDQSRQEDFSDVRNLSSNENAKEELNSNLRDDRGTEASKLYEDAGKLEDAMRANRERYEAGLANLKSEADRSKSAGSEGRSDSQRKDSKVSGRVTVSFSFTNPLRTSVKLVTPAYMCEGGGTVELTVTLDNNGSVISATVNKEASSGDECMQNAAIGAANKSRFNVDPSAPSRHRGTITYMFIPQ